MAETTTVTVNGTLPMLYIPHPQCTHCREDVTIEEGAAWCEGCLVKWDDISEDIEAQPDDNREGTEVQCEIVAGLNYDPYDHGGRHWVPGPPQPCILPSGHEGSHLCPYDVEVTDLG